MNVRVVGRATVHAMDGERLAPWCIGGRPLYAIAWTLQPVTCRRCQHGPRNALRRPGG